VFALDRREPARILERFHQYCCCALGDGCRERTVRCRFVLARLIAESIDSHHYPPFWGREMQQVARGRRRWSQLGGGWPTVRRFVGDSASAQQGRDEHYRGKGGQTDGRAPSGVVRRAGGSAGNSA